MRVRFLITLCFLCLGSFSSSGQIPLKSDCCKDSLSTAYPVPPDNKNMLFYLQRTVNTNTVVYELNYNKDGTVNEQDPVKVYWIRYADDGKIAPLSVIQKNYAYGVSCSLVEGEKKCFKVNLVSYAKTEILLMDTNDKHYNAYVKINGTLSILTKVFFKTEGGTFWSPNIIYVELTGKDIATGKTVVERFKP